MGGLDWQSLPHASACRIKDQRDGDIEDRESWAELVGWYLDKAEAFYATFSPLVQALDLDAGPEGYAPEEGAPPHK